MNQKLFESIYSVNNTFKNNELFESVYRLNEASGGWQKFTISAPESKAGEWIGIYKTEAMAKRCIKPILGEFEFISSEPLPTTVTQEMIDECPESCYVEANDTYSYNFYERVVARDIGYPIIRRGWRAYLVKDKEAFEEAKKDLVIRSIQYVKTIAQVGDKIAWEPSLTPALKANSLKESIYQLNEAKAVTTANAIVKGLEDYFKGYKNEAELLKLCQLWIASATGTGTNGLEDDLPAYYKNVPGSVANKVIAYAIIHCSDSPKAQAYFARYGKNIGYDEKVLQAAYKLSDENNDSLTANQALAKKIVA